MLHETQYDTLSKVHLGNEFNFWNVLGIMNTSGLLQSLRECSKNNEYFGSLAKLPKGLHVNFARDLKYS